MPACKKDFLHTLPTGSADEALLANEEGVNALLIGAYASLDGQIRGEDGASWAASVTNWIWGGVASDDATKGSDRGDQSSINSIEDFTVVPSNEYLANKWRFNYAGIARCNDVLRVMEKCDPPLPELAQNSIKAQALFLRAFIHFELKRVFNNIPYITENDDPREVSNSIDSWPFIEADLEFAIANLPENQDEVGRPTKYAAEAVLARVFLFQKKWEEARVLLDHIIASNKYELMTNFGDNFTHAERNNVESIFEIQYSVNDGPEGSPNAGWGDALNFPLSVDGLATCCGFYQPTQNLVNAFQVDENGLPILDGNIPDFHHDMNISSSDYFVQDTVTPVDPRLDLTIARRGLPFLDWGIMRGSLWLRDQSNGGPYLNKKNMYLKKDKGTYSTSSGWAIGVNSNNFRVVRYAHILLWRAEVAAETLDLAKATELVNMIRMRAGNQKLMGRCRTFNLVSQDNLEVDYSMPAANYVVNPYSEVFPSQEYARKAIRMEMRLEFAMEGMRFFDLVRWGIAAPTINAYLDHDRTLRSLFSGVQPAIFIPDRNEYWPIPQNQIELQPGILVQNPNY